MKAKGLLGTKAEAASGLHAYIAKGDEFVNAEQIALKALGIAQKVYSKDASFRDSLINIHLLLREIYSIT